jgi:hypothetical protein
MYRKFLAEYAPKHIRKPPVSRQWYHEIILSKFNLSFQAPKVDTCATCDSLAIKIKAGDASAKVEQEQQKQNKNYITEKQKPLLLQ